MIREYLAFVHYFLRGSKVNFSKLFNRQNEINSTVIRHDNSDADFLCIQFPHKSISWHQNIRNFKVKLIRNLMRNNAVRRKRCYHVFIISRSWYSENLPSASKFKQAGWSLSKFGSCWITKWSFWNDHQAWVVLNDTNYEFWNCHSIH